MFEASIDYLEFPVLVGASSPSGPVRVRVFGGPSFAFKVSDEATLAIDGFVLPDDPGDPEDGYPEFKGNDFGFIVGGAVEFGQVFIDLRYNWGLVDINDTPNDQDEIKTRTFGFMVGVRFR